MQYHKFILEDVIIEMHNSWLGEETISVNGQVVSKKSSVWGTNHYFTIHNSGKLDRFVLTTKVNEMMQVSLDLIRNGEKLYEDVIVRYGSKGKNPPNKEKKLGLVKLQEYDVVEAVLHLTKALDVNAQDPEIWFHLACAYSLMENEKEGFECLRKAVKNKLADTEMILQHEMLAYLRIQKAFDIFLESNFTQYDFKENLGNN